MFQLIYLSSATYLFSAEELNELLLTSRRNNASLGVTGLLLYKDGNLLQALEGEEQTVRALYSKIQRDPRHKGIILVLQEEIPQREFADWSMGFRKLTEQDASALEGYSDFLNKPWPSTVTDELPSKCRRLLNTFRNTVR